MGRTASAPGLPPAAPGAYILWIRLDAALTLDIPRFAGRILEPGLYAYCGSAHGPGGLRARVAHHLDPGRARHWHVDRLTAAGTVQHVECRLGGCECDLAAALLARGARVPIRGFGSSDCRRCPSHLLRLDGEPL